MAKSGLKLPEKKEGDLPETEDEWVSYINLLHGHAVEARRKYEFQWVINIAYYMGYQNLLYNTKSGALEFNRESASPLVINRISSFIDARHSKLTKSRPVPRVIPNTTDIEDKQGAKNSDDALSYLWRKEGVEHEYDKMVIMKLLCGTSFLKTVWDPNRGDVIKERKKTADDDELILEEDGGMAYDKIFMGEVSTRALSAFAILPGNDTIPELRDQPWLIERVFVNVIDAEKIWPELRGKIKPEGPETMMTDYERTVQRFSSPVFHSLGTHHSTKQDSLNSQCLVKVYWQRPNVQYEKGIMAVVVGNCLASIGTFPNDYGSNIYPYVKFSERESGFHFWNQATLERLIPIQRAYNSLKQQVLRNAKLMANLKWLNPKGSGIVPEALTDEAGEVIDYNAAAGAPTIADVKPLPNFLTQMSQELVIDFRDVGGQRENSVTPPPNITAGIAMTTAAELSDEIIGPILRLDSSRLEIVANQQLLLMNEEWVEPRKIKILGSDGEVGVQWMSHLDLNNQTDVHVEIESMLPELRGSKRQTLLDLWDRKIIQDPEIFMDAFMYGNWDVISQPADRLNEQIALDIAALKKGKMPEINQFQNHAAYVKKLTEYINTPEFLRLIPQRKAQIVQYMQQHADFIIQSLPGAGAPQPGQNPNAVGTPFGPTVPAGADGNVA